MATTVELEDTENDFNEPQYSTAHDYGTVTSTKTVSIADGNNLELTTTSSTNLTLTASDFIEDMMGSIKITKGGTETVSFDSTFSGEDAQDLSAAGTYEIAFKSQAATVTLATAVTV